MENGKPADQPYTPEGVSRVIRRLSEVAGDLGVTVVKVGDQLFGDSVASPEPEAVVAEEENSSTD